MFSCIEDDWGKNPWCYMFTALFIQLMVGCFLYSNMLIWIEAKIQTLVRQHTTLTPIDGVSLIVLGIFYTAIVATAYIRFPRPYVELHGLVYLVTALVMNFALAFHFS